jgi:CheY-like chemotaxis protein
MKRILIIDDNKMLANVYRSSLAGAGFAVDVAHDGESGLSAARQTPPDVVLLDMMMPGMDGVAVLSALRADAALNAVPVIVCSNSYTPDRMEKLWQAGATQVLVKASSSPRAILEAVRTALAAKT